MKAIYGFLALLTIQLVWGCSESEPKPPAKVESTHKSMSENPRTEVVLLTHTDLEGCDRRVVERKTSINIFDACETYTSDRNLEQAFCREFQEVLGGTEVCVTNESNRRAHIATKGGPDVTISRAFLMDADAYSKDDISGNCIPTMDRFLKDKKERISVPSDPSAKYYFIGDIQRNSFGNLQIATLRYGKSGSSISGREISCRSWKFQYVVDGHCGTGSDGILRPLTEGSISSHIAAFACNYKGPIYNVSE